MSLNQILLIGNCGSDPEMRYTPNGSMVVNFSLAVNSYRNSPDGDQIQETEWFRVACWNKTAESVNQFLQKGQRCFVEGRFRSSNYTANDGTQRQSSCCNRRCPRAGTSIRTGLCRKRNANRAGRYEFGNVRKDP